MKKESHCAKTFGIVYLEGCTKLFKSRIATASNQIARLLKIFVALVRSIWSTVKQLTMFFKTSSIKLKCQNLSTLIWINSRFSTKTSHIIHARLDLRLSLQLSLEGIIPIAFDVSLFESLSIWLDCVHFSLRQTISHDHIINHQLPIFSSLRLNNFYWFPFHSFVNFFLKSERRESKSKTYKKLCLF